MTRDQNSKREPKQDIPDDTDDVRFYRRKSQARIKATTVLDVFVEMLLSGQGEALRQHLQKNNFEMRAPPELVNLIKTQIITDEVHKSSNVLAAAAKSDDPTCPSWPVPQWNTTVMLARADSPKKSEGEIG